MSTKKTIAHFIKQLHPLHRVVISLGLSVITFIGIQNTDLNIFVKLLIVWNVYALSYCLTSWIVFFSRTCDQIMQHAREEDGSRIFVYFVILLSSFASLFNVLLLISSDDATKTASFVYVPLTILGMLLSWMMVHITFAFHYAHLFYDDDDEGNSHKHAGGLDFPNENKPDYLDFAYFSFIIGMTFQVSDVEITSKKLRRIVLLHSLLAFGLNTFVVALTINLIAGLKGEQSVMGNG